MIKKNKNDKVLAGIHPNAGLSADYQRRLDTLIDAMQRSTVYWITAAYNAKPPEMALDADYTGSPAVVMGKVMKRLSKKWQKKFNEASLNLASYFSQAFADRTDSQLQSALRKGGISVKFKPTRVMNDIIQANIGGNVSLIQSIPERYYTDIEGSVMRSVAQGRDIGGLTLELQKTYGITKRRAKLIAHHQNNLATGQMQKARQIEIGITKATWRHSHGGKVPRPSHVKAGADKLQYDVSEGAFIDDEYIFPGELVGCRCFSKPVISGYND